jgi:hypothetical protein
MSEDKTDEVNIKKELSPFIKSFGKVSSTTKQKPPSKKTTKRKYQTQTSIMKSFGKTSKKNKKKKPDLYKSSSRRRSNKPKPPPKPPEVIPEYCEMKSAIDAYNCKNKNKHTNPFWPYIENYPEDLPLFSKDKDYSNDPYYYKNDPDDPYEPFRCRNLTCICSYKRMGFEDFVLAYNKEMIIAKVDEQYRKGWGETTLGYDWSACSLPKYKINRVYQYIKQCEFIFNLGLYIYDDDDMKWSKLKSATAALNCKDRVVDGKYYCKGDNYLTPKMGTGCRCYYSALSIDDVKREAAKEYLIEKTKDEEFNYWDRLTLSFDWLHLSKKQNQMVNRLIIKYHNKLKN